MNTQEAKAIMATCHAHGCDYIVDGECTGSKECFTAHEMAIQALEHEEEYRELKERATPKKPTNYGGKWACECGYVVGNGNEINCMYYCSRCGHAIDWEVEE